ncbi:MAG: DUF2510 domain-containing protein [Pseudolysinimonas sp.]
MDEAPAAAAGWYPDADDPGLLRYWTGMKWTNDRSPAIASPTLSPAVHYSGFAGTHEHQRAAGAKSLATAYVLWGLLGGWGGHRHYLRRHGAAIAQTVLSLLAVILANLWLSDPSATGLLWVTVLLTAFNLVWWISDAIALPRWVQEINDAEASEASETIAERRDRRTAPDTSRPTAFPFRFDEPSATTIVLDPASIPWELRDDPS